MAVYVVMRADGFVKIGTSNDPQTRLRSLAAEHKQHMILLRTMDGGRRHERWMHLRFLSYRTHNEWFVFNREMMTVSIPELAYEGMNRKVTIPRKVDPAWLGKHPEQVALIKEINAKQPGITADWIASELGVSLGLAKEYMNAATAEWQHATIRAEWQNKDAHND